MMFLWSWLNYTSSWD
uniref:Uncharacterized protein n=1 Tax=Rhizophora mucronata TaxID=61149 RepID=A0A2P2J7Z6_RHIMU